MTGWRVFWVPKARAVNAARVPVLTGLEDLAEREDRTGIHAGDPILLSPDFRIDELLSLFLCRSSFARLAAETKRNYTDDYVIFFDFLWARGKTWDEATADDLWDFEDWRTRSPRNPRKVGAARWNRGLAALTRRQGDETFSSLQRALDKKLAEKKQRRAAAGGLGLAS